MIMPYIKYHFLLLVAVVSSTCSCSCSPSKRATVIVATAKGNVITDTFPAKANGIYILNKDFDLNGKTYVLPKGVTIRKNNGVFKNGTLIGQDTRIEGKLPIFDRVTIKGEWNVPEISTLMFKDLNYDNSLRDVMALTNDKVNNKVTIHKGVYFIRLSKNQEDGIRIGSYTNVLLDGEIHLRPNFYSNYSIVKLNGKICSLEGCGAIIGDKFTHTGKVGEWGMGVEVERSNNAIISGLTIKECWGDCIYVGHESGNVTIKKCKLDNGRRQGISITSANHVRIYGCVISNVAGTEPQYAIDIEPNIGKEVTDVIVNNVRSVNCVGGIDVVGIAKNSKIKNVSFYNCTVKGASKKYPMILMKAENVVVENCDIDSKSDYSMLIQDVAILKARNNIFRAKGNKHLNKIHSKDLKMDNNQFFIKK